MKILKHIKQLFFLYNITIDDWIKKVINNSTYDSYKILESSQKATHVEITYNDFIIDVIEEKQIRHHRKYRAGIYIRDINGKLIVYHDIDEKGNHYNGIGSPIYMRVSKQCLLDICDVYEGILNNQK